MKGLNKVELIGNLGADPEMRYTPAGKAVTTFSMATSRKYTDEHGALVEDTQWHNVVCWEKLAENCNQALCKGSAVYVSGRINYRQWQDKEEKWHNKTEIIASDCIFLDKKTAQAVTEDAPAVESTQPAPVEVAPAVVDKVLEAALAAGAVPVGES